MADDNNVLAKLLMGAPQDMWRFPNSYQPLETPQMPPAPPSQYEQLGQKLQPIAPYLPVGGLMSMGTNPDPGPQEWQYPGRLMDTVPDPGPGTLPKNSRELRDQMLGQAMGVGIRRNYKF